MRPKQLRILILGAVITWCLPWAGCRRDDPGTVNVVGSTSIQPFAELLAQEYEKKNPDHKVDVQGGGSTAGLQAVANGLAQIGMCSRGLTPEESKQFTGVMIARDGLAVVVNPANPVSELKMEQVRGLFSGQIKNWKDIGGRDEPVRVITREESSGTRECFVHLVMGQEKISREALVQESSGAVKELVKGNTAAIGYISLGLVGKELKALVVDGEQPTAQNVLDGKYKLARPLLFVTKGSPSPAAQKFIDFVLLAESQKTLEAEGLIRAR
ncbi:MAG TPA: phosphate ABC transporter substrate-binding protein [Phycisphaerae bacterium]|nr:phosphate ABC transporter substrate-binding protein [Phycisphaerae bacterium]